MKPLLLVLLLLCTAFAQKQKADPELVRLRDEYVKATQDYKTSLNKLLALYEDDVLRAERKLEWARQQNNEGLLAKGSVDFAAQELEKTKSKVQETKLKIANADEQIAKLPKVEQLAPEYKKALTKKRRSNSGLCHNWRLSAYRKETKGTITISYSLVCDK